MPVRKAKINRKTKETQIAVSIALDGKGLAEVNTGIGFFDHMLTLLAKHGKMNLMIAAKGDLHVDPHHTVEDVGICLGKALLDTVADVKGMTRYGHAVIPMDEALAEAAVDISGRPFLSFNAELPRGRVGEFDIELVEEFLRAVAVNARMTVHIVLRYGKNTHHCIEAIFKAFARALGEAVQKDPRVKDVPSTKGMLET
ncbi:MAG TPA: imidazoleglycerol-phosphate dehydratase HisB [Candidatus Hydrogenedentes bacterium]|nr:imidazoleglycerol-phosphate dehydratase HisB [Candidatus Hydrogenedentota bacterium]